jgi:hypothetical protein
MTDAHQILASVSGMPRACRRGRRPAVRVRARSKGLYRLPFADRTMVKVFDDFITHRPRGRVDLFAVEGTKPYRVVAAAAGRIMAIQDSGFLTDNDGGKRERNPRFCGVAGETVVKDATHRAVRC